MKSLRVIGRGHFPPTLPLPGPRHPIRRTFLAPGSGMECVPTPRIAPCLRAWRCWLSVFHRRNKNLNSEMYGIKLKISLDAFVCGNVSQILAFIFALVTLKFSVHNLFKLKWISIQKLWFRVVLITAKTAAETVIRTTLYCVRTISLATPFYKKEKTTDPLTWYYFLHLYCPRPVCSTRRWFRWR